MQLVKWLCTFSPGSLRSFLGLGLCIPSNGLFCCCCSVPCSTLLWFICMCCHPFFSALLLLQLTAIGVANACLSFCSLFVVLTSVVVFYSSVHLWEFCFSHLSMSYVNVGTFICLVIIGLPSAQHSAARHSMNACVFVELLNE